VGRTPGAVGPKGFTLLEILVAVILTSVVVLIASSALRVSLDARDRFTAGLTVEQRARVTRELLIDALRNTRTPQRSGDTTFTLDSNRLTFVAAGGGPPLDADCDWRVTIAPDSSGLMFVAIPVGRSPMAEVAFRLPGVTRWDVRVLPAIGSDWLDAWPAAMVTPRALTITLWNRGERVDPPIRVAF
jgi:prepilin-type N-terminal cleavage/methylation domain-containing protein